MCKQRLKRAAGTRGLGFKTTGDLDFIRPMNTFFFFFLAISGLHPWHIQVPGFELEL